MQGSLPSQWLLNNFNLRAFEATSERLEDEQTSWRNDSQVSVLINLNTASA